MSQSAATFFEQWPQKHRQLKEQAPDIARGFGAMHQAVMKDGALSLREKELIALAVGLAERCLPCINLHVRGCLEAGATREQILEAAGVVVMMRGGPSFTHVPEVIAALDHLEKK